MQSHQDKSFKQTKIYLLFHILTKIEHKKFLSYFQVPIYLRKIKIESLQLLFKACLNFPNKLISEMTNLSEKIILILVLIVSSLIVSQCAPLIDATNPGYSNAGCSQGYYLVHYSVANQNAILTGGGSPTLKTYAKCVKDQDKVLNCYAYNQENGKCYCDSTGQTVPRLVVQQLPSSPLLKGCIPKNQPNNILNGLCIISGQNINSYPVNTLSCLKLQLLQVQLQTTYQNNPNKYTTAYITMIIPNCNKFKVRSATPDMDYYPLIIGNQTFSLQCVSCKDGYKKFGLQNPTKFKYYPIFGNGNFFITSMGCPSDSITFDLEKSNFIIYSGDNNYDCECKSGVQNQIWFAVDYETSKIQPIQKGCALFTNSVIGCLTYSYSTNINQIKCFCPNKGKLISILNELLGDPVITCYTGAIIDGCSQYYMDILDIILYFNSQSQTTKYISQNLNCITCIDKINWDFIKTGSYPLSFSDPNINKRTGLCVPKSRYTIYNQQCSYYLLQSSDLQSVNSLICNSITSDNIDLMGLQNPFVKNQPNYAGECNDGRLQVTDGTLKGCITSGIVDNCKKYNTGWSSTDSIINVGCSQCANGFEFFITQSSNTPQTLKNRPCGPSAKKDANCEEYYHQNFACSKCKNNMKFNKDLGRCAIQQTPTQPQKQVSKIVGCAKTVSIGAILLCITCTTDQTLVEGYCAKSVPFCAQLRANGICLRCISNYQLIDNQCIKVPQNCDKVDATGKCIQCKTNFVTNSQGICQYPQPEKTCSNGMILMNGQCVNAPKNDVPTKRQCPSNNDKFKFRNNPLDPLGDCIAEDIKCSEARDDGHCWKCQEGFIPGWNGDGLCYEINQLFNFNIDN